MAGRPKKEPGEQKSNTLRIRLTDEEKAAMQAAAKDERLDVSTWARRILLDFLEGKPLTQPKAYGTVKMSTGRGRKVAPHGPRRP